MNELAPHAVDRRRFLAAAACGVPTLLPGAALGAGAAASPSNRIVMATIGVGGRGTADMQSFLAFPEVQMAAVCDPVVAHRERAREIVNRRYGNQQCAAYADFREALDRDDIDAVLIGTPDHWHALITIEACRRGKDVFCEKPESLTVREGRAMVEAARTYGRVVSGGSQRVLGDYGDLPRLVRGGAMGELREVYVSCGDPSGECHLPAQEIPEGVDWEMWLGPAPWRPFHASLLVGKYRPYRDYSGGGMTDWGAHRFGAALFATGLHHTGPVEITPPDGEATPLLTFRFANGVKFYHNSGPGRDLRYNNIVYCGSEGEAPGNHAPHVAPVDIEGYRGRGGIFGDFLHCVKTRQRPFRDIEIAHRACTVCHLGNIAYWLGRPLRWDPDKEQILGDPEASRWLDRPKRAPWGAIA